MRIDRLGSAELPLSLGIVKAHLRLDTDDTTEDELLLLYLGGAVSEAEAATRRQIARQRYRLSGVAPARVIELPIYPVASVESVEGPDGALAPGDYDLRTDTLPMQLLIESPPSGPLTVELTAGHEESGDMPEHLASLILLLVGHRYEHREAVTVGVSGTALPRAVHDLIWLTRVAL